MVPLQGLLTVRNTCAHKWRESTAADEYWIWLWVPLSQSGKTTNHYPLSSVLMIPIEICGNAFSPRRHIQGIEATQTFTAKRLEHGNAYRGPAVILVLLDRERAIDVQFPVARWVRLPSPFPLQCCHVCQQRYTKSCCRIRWAQAIVAADCSVSEVHEYGEPMFMLRAVSGDE
jgi:hypothetical protein